MFFMIEITEVRQKLEHIPFFKWNKKYYVKMDCYGSLCLMNKKKQRLKKTNCNYLYKNPDTPISRIGIFSLFLTFFFTSYPFHN